MRNNDYIIKKVFRKYLLFSIFSSITLPMVMMVNGVIIGNFLGKEAMAAAGLVSPLLFLFSAFSGIISSGSTSLCGQYIGSEQPEKVKSIFSTAILWSLIMYLICMATCFCIPEQLAHLLGARGSSLPPAANYIRGLGAGMGLTVLHLALVEFTKLDGSPALGPISIVVLNIANVALGLVNVFWFKMGIFGIALATSISFMIAIAICCIHFFMPVHTLKLVKIEKPFCNFIALCASGLPRAGNGICFSIATVFTNVRLVFLGGSVAIAAFSILSNVALVLSSICMGVGSTTLLMSGIFYGEEDKKALERAVKVSLYEGVFITIMACILCFIFLNPIVLLFGQADSNVTTMAISAVRWRLIGLVVFTVNHVFVNYYQSTGNLKMANFLSITEALPSQVLYVIVLPLFMGINGVWASWIMGCITSFFVLTIAVACQNGRFPRTIKEYLLFPKSFGVDESMQLNFSISNNVQEVVSISKQVYAFCKEQGVDARRSYFLSLCVEEMAGNITKYAFSDQKEHFIDIRIIQKGEQLILRLRDDGTAFNPLTKDLGKDANIGENIGIHLIQTLASSMEYRYTTGLNNLLIKL